MKFGYVAILGKPNVGKSTLLNALVGEKVSIVCWKPQTTRNIINGIVNGDDFQMVLVDTPGLHNAVNKLSQYMTAGIEKAIETIDVIIYMVNGSKFFREQELATIAELAKNYKVIVAVNKQDIASEEAMFAILAEIGKVKGVKDIIPMSVYKKINLQLLQQKVVELLPEGERQFDEDLYTDKSLRFMVSELIREKALHHLQDEIPYGVGVVIDEFKPREGSDVIDISSTIYCEKKAHKNIIIGKGGEMLKVISSEARADMEKLIGNRVYLQCWVKVKPDWRDSEYLLREIGYDKKDFN